MIEKNNHVGYHKSLKCKFREDSTVNLLWQYEDIERKIVLNTIFPGK